jgi:hypothetical protein
MFLTAKMSLGRGGAPPPSGTARAVACQAVERDDLETALRAFLTATAKESAKECEMVGAFADPKINDATACLR